jgi:hypothetical protein
MNKIEKEKKILALMIELYCHKAHKNNTLCQNCLNLKEYAFTKLDKCPFKANKKPCKICVIHCYEVQHRLQIKEVMRFSGPRILFYYPLEFFKHL